MFLFCSCSRQYNAAMPVELIKGRGATRNRNPDALQPEGADGRGRMARQRRGARRHCRSDGRRSRSSIRRASSPATARRTSASTVRSTPIRGCEHGCIYCFARPTHAYHDLSPGVDFESRLFVKPNAAQLLHAVLSRPGYECAPIAMGTNTDPYQPIEETWRVTRSLVELLVETRHPFSITTKSDRVLRDLDLLKPAAELGIVSVALSVTSLDREDRPNARAASARPAQEGRGDQGAERSRRAVPYRDRARRSADHGP